MHVEKWVLCHVACIYRLFPDCDHRNTVELYTSDRWSAAVLSIYTTHESLWKKRLLNEWNIVNVTQRSLNNNRKKGAGRGHAALLSEVHHEGNQAVADRETVKQRGNLMGGFSEFRTELEKKGPSQWTQTVCSYLSLSCSVPVKERDHRRQRCGEH